MSCTRRNIIKTIGRNMRRTMGRSISFGRNRRPGIIMGRRSYRNKLKMNIINLPDVVDKDIISVL